MPLEPWPNGRLKRLRKPLITPARPLRQSLRRSTQEAAQPRVNVQTRSRSAAVQEKLKQDNSDDIAKAIEVAEDLTKLSQAFSQSHSSIFLDLPRRKVFRYGNVVIKFGLDVSPYEAKVLQFIDKTINIPVPRLYYDYVHSEGTVVIAMEYIEGRLLSEAWPTLHNHEKMNIVQQLREILEKMRQHQMNFIGGIYNTPAVDIRITSREGGPFSTEEQFNQFLRSGIIPAAPKIYRWMLEGAMKKDHDIVLTHGDISPQNIIINNGQIVAILDWESAGWYPEYWEFVKFFSALDPLLDWCDYAQEIFSKTYINQYLVNSFLGGFIY